MSVYSVCLGFTGSIRWLMSKISSHISKDWPSTVLTFFTRDKTYTIGNFNVASGVLDYSWPSKWSGRWEFKGGRARLLGPKTEQVGGGFGP